MNDKFQAAMLKLMGQIQTAVNAADSPQDISHMRYTIAREIESALNARADTSAATLVVLG